MSALFIGGIGVTYLNLDKQLQLRTLWKAKWISSCIKHLRSFYCSVIPTRRYICYATWGTYIWHDYRLNVEPLTWNLTC